MLSIYIASIWLIFHWYLLLILKITHKKLYNKEIRILKSTSFPFVSPFSNHSTVKLRWSQLTPDTIAECTLPIKYQNDKLFFCGSFYLFPSDSKSISENSPNPKLGKSMKKNLKSLYKSINNFWICTRHSDFH